MSRSRPWAPPIGAYQLSDEERIVWCQGHHPELYAGSYVREVMTITLGHSRRPHEWGPQLVAYTVLKPNADRRDSGGRYRRRVWWLAKHDPYTPAGHPHEAVDPLRIRAGRASSPPRIEALGD